MDQQQVEAQSLRPGDTIAVWWKPGRDTITALRPYTGPIECLRGGFVADFALNTTGMTVEPNGRYTVLARAA